MTGCTMEVARSRAIARFDGGYLRHALVQYMRAEGQVNAQR